MPKLDRREFLKLAAALGATLAWGCTTVQPSSSGWRERRDLYPQGVASGDPDDSSVLLWTRRPYADGRKDATLLVEIAEDPTFTRVIATTAAKVSAESDWTCRVLAGDLRPAGEYWYRFVDEDGNGSRIGRTLTAPSPDDNRPAKFAFVSCQCLPEGYNNGYRRMIHEDEKATPDERLGFVLHLGDFIYEVVQYPDQARNGRFDRKAAEKACCPHHAAAGESAGMHCDHAKMKAEGDKGAACCAQHAKMHPEGASAEGKACPHHAGMMKGEAGADGKACCAQHAAMHKDGDKTGCCCGAGGACPHHAAAEAPAKS